MNLRGRNPGKVPKPGEAAYSDWKNPSKKSKLESSHELDQSKDPEAYADCEKQMNPPADFKPAQNLISKESLESDLSKINNSFKFEPDVLDLILDIMEDFVVGISDRACKLAVHRRSDTVSVEDYKLALELDWTIRIPGVPTDAAQAQKPPSDDNENKEFAQEESGRIAEE